MKFPLQEVSRLAWSIGSLIAAGIRKGFVCRLCMGLAARSTSKDQTQGRKVNSGIVSQLSGNIVLVLLIKSLLQISTM